jgi:hypothetical protein
MVASCGCRGLSDFAEARALRALWGKSWAARGSNRFVRERQAKAHARKSQVRQRSLLLTSPFGYFCGYKSNSPRGN